MTIEDTNPHARNLSLICLGFILFWLLDIRTTGSSINIYPINAEISSPHFLPWVAWVMLAWFFWRFWVTSSESFWKRFSEHNINASAKLPTKAKRKVIEKHYNKVIDYWSKDLSRGKLETPTEEELRIRNVKAVFDRPEKHWELKIDINSSLDKFRGEGRYRNLLMNVHCLPMELKLFTLNRLLNFLLTNPHASGFVPPYVLFCLAVITGVLTLIGCHP